MEYEGLRNKTLDYNFTSLGGGIESILLRDFNVTTRREEDDSTTEEKVQLNHHLEIPAMSVLFGSLDAASPMPYQLSQQGDQIMATTQTEEGLRVTKTFTPTTNYVIQASIRIENTSEARNECSRALRGDGEHRPHHAGRQGSLHGPSLWLRG